MQQQQQALYQQQLASNQVLSFQTPGLAPPRVGAHRRVQSTLPLGMGVAPFAGGQAAMGQFGQLGDLGVGAGSLPTGVPRGHGRRHSVNVLNKSNTQPGLGNMFASSQDGFDDGFIAPTGLPGNTGGHGHSDSTWRISKQSFLKCGILC